MHSRFGIVWGLWAAIVVTMLGAVCYNWCIVPPINEVSAPTAAGFIYIALNVIVAVSVPSLIRWASEAKGRVRIPNT